MDEPVRKNIMVKIAKPRIRSYSNVFFDLYDRYVSLYNENEVQATQTFIELNEYVEARKDFYEDQIIPAKDLLKENLQHAEGLLVAELGQQIYTQKKIRMVNLIDDVFTSPHRECRRFREKVLQLFRGAEDFYESLPEERRSVYLKSFPYIYKNYQKFINLSANQAILSWMLKKILDSSYSIKFNLKDELSQSEKEKLARKMGVSIWNIKPHPDVIFLRFQKLKEDMLVKNAFEALKEELVDEGLNPREYNLKDDASSFNRLSNNRISDLNRNKTSQD